MRQASRFGLAVIAALMLSGCTVSADSPRSPEPAATPQSTKPVESSPPSPEAPASTEAVISVASVDVDGAHFTAAGYVGGLIEDGGACSFTITSGGMPTTADSLGRSDRATTSCGSVSVPREALTRGPASVVLTYTGLDGHRVESEPVELEIP